MNIKMQVRIKEKKKSLELREEDREETTAEALDRTRTASTAGLASAGRITVLGSD